MFALYELVEVAGGKRRRNRFRSIYNSEESLFEFLNGVDDLSQYKVELVDAVVPSKIPAKKVREIIIRNSLIELGYPRNIYTGILFDGIEYHNVTSDEIANNFEVPGGCQFALITQRYTIDDNGDVALEAVNSRIADTESVHNAIRRERENAALAEVGLQSAISDEMPDNVLVEN